MRYTLLEMVQLILSSMDSDEVNNWDDTVESVQVANLLKSVYYDMATELNLPEADSLVELNASGLSTRPVLMTVPTNVYKLKWVKYDNKLATDTNKNYQDVCYLPFEEFFKRQLGLREQGSTTGEMSFTMNSGETFDILYANDRMPTYYTDVDNTTLLFDAIDLAVDTTLQKSKTLCMASVYPSFSLSNSFIPSLDPTQFSYYINRAKVRAFSEIKQADNREALMETRNQKIVLQKRKFRTENEPRNKRPIGYGRK